MKKFSFSRLLKPYALNKVFTPSTVAKLTYVQRKSIEDDLIKNLSIPGLQIVLYGHSGCGKTTLLMNKLNEKKYLKIKTNCTDETTFNQLIIEVIDKLGVFYKDDVSVTAGIKISSEYKTKFKIFESSIDYEINSEESEKYKRVVPIQLSIERLAEFLGYLNCIWVIEDFHKVKEAEKVKLSQVLKVFMDAACDYPNVKIVCIGAVGTARELIYYDRELANRVSEMFVPLMSNAELKELVSKGFKLMNIYPNENDLIDKIVHYSNNLASVCHQLCYDMCYNKNIVKSSFVSKKITLKDFEEAVKCYIRKTSDTYNNIYENICGKRNYKEICKNLININKEVFFSEDVLKSKKSLTNNEKSKALLELTSMNNGEILRYNSMSKTFSFSNPFFQAFLKMKFAIERADERNRQNKHNLELYESNFSDDMFQEYFKYMNIMLEKKLNEIGKIKKI